MSELVFSEKLNIEIVRGVEQAEVELPEDQNFNRVAGRTFPARLFERANRIFINLQLNPILINLQRKFSLITVLLCLMFIAFGAIAAVQAFPNNTEQTVNFFWLLLVLLGLNAVLMLFWIIAWLARKLRQGQSFIVPLYEWLLKMLSAHKQPKATEMAVTLSWLRVMGDGVLGFWLFSRISHGIWLAYLLGGLATILLMLFTRQFDFVWETTLLSEPAFLVLTEKLSIIPASLGVSVPSAEQVAMSRVGADSLELADVRIAWAQLLISSILIYGVFPRLLLLCFSGLMFRLSQRRFELSFTDPYYIQLRHNLQADTHHLGVIDPDDVKIPSVSPASTQPVVQNIIPDDAVWLAIELNPKLAWPPVHVPALQIIGQANDRESRTTLAPQLTGVKHLSWVMAVDLKRTPDRGLEKYIDSLVERCEATCWLALMVNKPTNTVEHPLTEDEKNRLIGWSQLAARVNIPLDQVNIIALRDAE